MTKTSEPIVLDLATLPREQLGPFLLLGLDKSADKDQIEANWAERLKWARKGLMKVPLEDINWAKDVLTERDRRIRADAASFNIDLIDSVLGQLAYRYGVIGSRQGRSWQPLDVEKDLANYTPPAEVPDQEEIRLALTVPDVPQALPAVPTLLERLAQVALDPWGFELPRMEGSASKQTQDPTP
jgi:hypothetical protein